MARRARELDPDNEEGVRRLMGLLDRRGDRGGALRVYTEWQARLLEEYGVEPDPETRKLARRVQAARKGESEETQPVPPPVRRPPPQSGTSIIAQSPRRARRIVVPALIAFGIFSTGATLYWRNATAMPRVSERSVAVLPLRVTGDSALQRIADTFAEELTSVLASDSTISVRSAVRAHDIVRQSRDVTGLARQLGVTYLVEGGVLQGQHTARITLRLLRAADAIVLWTGTFDTDVMTQSLSPNGMAEVRNAIVRNMSSR
jgi:TolB-like protein